MVKQAKKVGKLGKLVKGPQNAIFQGQKIVQLAKKGNLSVELQIHIR